MGRSMTVLKYAVAGGVAAAAVALVRKQRRRTSAGGGARIVILGAGFAGLSAARRLAQRVPAAEITVVDRQDYHLFTPMLYQVAACGLDPYDISYPLRRLVGSDTFHFRRATIRGIDTQKRTVQFDDGEISFDYLLIALGSQTNYFGSKSAQQHALPLKWLDDGVRVRQRLLHNLEEASTTSDAQRRESLLRVVVVGGGATGVEFAAALATFFDQAVPSAYPSLSRDDCRIAVVEGEDRLIGHMGEGLSRMAAQRLTALGIELRFKVEAREVQPGSVTLSDGSSIASELVLWTTGVEASRIVAGLDLPHKKSGTLAVDQQLLVHGETRIFAAGDCAYLQLPGDAHPLPMLGAVAVQEGSHAAGNIERALAGEPLAPFHYTDYGNMVALGHLHGGVSVRGLTFGGLPGWVAWRLVHLAKNTGFRDQIATVIDWSIGYSHSRNLAQVTLPSSRSPARADQAQPST